MKTTRNELKLRADKCPIKRFKAFIGKANTQATLCADTGIEIIGWSGFDASDLNAKSHRVELARFIAAADPETILALLAELEAKDKRITELEGKLQSGFTPEALAQEERAENAEQRVAELEAKLATPIKIVNYDEFFICHVSGASDDYCKGWVDGRNAAARDVGKAGFTVEDK
jgi:hypothetical protein